MASPSMPKLPVGFSCDALRPPTYWALRLRTMTLRLTASGALFFGAPSESGVPRELDTPAVEVSELDRPSRNVPPVAAPARPAPPKINAIVTTMTDAGLTARADRMFTTCLLLRAYAAVTRLS